MWYSCILLRRQKKLSFKPLTDNPTCLVCSSGTGDDGNVETTRSHSAPSPRWWSRLRGGTKPGLRSAARIRGQPAASGHDEADDGNGAGEEGADAHAGAAEAVPRAAAAAAAAASS